MALVFNYLSDEAILKLSENPTPEEELYGMAFGEIEVLNGRIDKLALAYDHELVLFGRLMRLRSHISIIKENVRKRDEEYR